MAVRISGTVQHGDGSEATRTKVTFEAASMKSCFTDGSGRYSIEMGSAVKAAYVNGRKVWSGSCSGGTLNLRV